MNPASTEARALHRRLAVTRGRGHADHTATARPSRLDQPAATHETWAKLRDRKLRVEQPLIEANNRGRRAAPVLCHGRILRTDLRAVQRSQSGGEAARAMQPAAGVRR
jgi:hypothetical protein